MEPRSTPVVTSSLLIFLGRGVLPDPTLESLYRESSAMRGLKVWKQNGVHPQVLTMHNRTILHNSGISWKQNGVVHSSALPYS